MKRVVASMDNSCVAVFWCIHGSFVGPEDTIFGNNVVQFGDYLQVNEDHFTVWPSVAKSLKINPRKFDYDYFPRGRVMFNTALHKFVVIGDDKIVDNEDLLDALVRRYSLPSRKGLIIKHDEHYQSIASAE